VANEYASLATIKAHLGIEASDTSRDTLLNAALAAASRGIDRDTGRRFWLDADPVARMFRLSGRTVCDEDGERLLVDDIGNITGLVVETGSGGSWTAVTDYEATPYNALLDGRPITALLRTLGTWGYGTQRVRVTARWGWPAVPDEVVQATLIQATRLYKRKDSPEGIIGSAEWGVRNLSRVDPDVYALVRHFVLPGFG
jgi:hypothetical protein